MYQEHTMLRYYLRGCAFLSLCVCIGLAYTTTTIFKRNMTLDDKKMTGKIMKKIKNSSFESCSQTCASEPFCLRFAFNTHHYCWLYNEVYDSEEDNMKTSVGWRNFQMEDLVLPITLEVLLILTTWDEALTECKNRGMTLAILSNDITFTAAQKYIQTIPQLKKTDGVWIGLRSEGNAMFRWMDETIATDAPWDRNEPSGNDVRCATLNPHRCLLRDNTCKKTRYVLCGE